jgi:hypothetical protein
MEDKKKKRGRPNMYSEPTVSLHIKVPKSHYTRLKTILEYELSKLQIIWK